MYAVCKTGEGLTFSTVDSGLTTVDVKPALRPKKSEKGKSLLCFFMLKGTGALRGRYGESGGRSG